MTSVAQQMRYRELDPQHQRGSDQRLFIDLDVCASHQCKTCAIQCSYYELLQNNGIRSVIELATYALVCRRCEDPHCVKACPVDALEQQKEKGSLLVRHDMLCISCQSCSLACPYGTIYADYVPLLSHNCDFCLDRRGRKDEPLCVKTCSHGALRLTQGDFDGDENTFLVGDHLIVHSTHWKREKA